MEESNEQTIPVNLITVAEMENIEKCFTYHAPKLNQPQKYKEFREQARRSAILIMKYCPSSRERSLALTKLEEAIMWVNASIARNE